MNTKIIRWIALAIFVALSPVLGFAQSLPLVPEPASVQVDPQERLKLPARISVGCSEAGDWTAHLNIVSNGLMQQSLGKHKFTWDVQGRPLLSVNLDSSLAPEAYQLDVTEAGIRMKASTLKGLAHATATFLQLAGSAVDQSIPHLTIQDAPESRYRNLMVDMGRNPHSLALLKETIDLLWFYKVDSLQLHLTDDQRFAFPSTKFPKLWDGKITADQFRELERYAVLRGVTIIPELEVPGHSGILRGRYPEVFGKSATDLARSEKALEGIKILLDEMVDIFSSSPYVHVGGDEAFGVPEELQRDLINKLHRYLKSIGKKTLVWEGPRPGKGENKVNEEVIHLNWRTINYPADRMLKDGYQVVNAAWDPLYLVDHYPRINFTMASPQRIYEQLKLSRFKHFNPEIRTFAKPIEVKPTDRIIGFCMPWWEGREHNFVPQVFPRVIPFAEVAWKQSGTRDYTKFSERVQRTERCRHRMSYPVDIMAPNLAIAADGVFHNQTEIKLESKMDSGIIRYTLDQTEPTVESTIYQEPIKLSKSATVRAAFFRDGVQVGHGSRQNLTRVVPVENLALGKPVTSTLPSASPFSIERLTDGGVDNLDFYLAYPAEPTPVEVTVDLEKEEAISRVKIYAYTISNSFEKYTVEVSVDGKSFEEVANRKERPKKSEKATEHTFDSRKARYVRIKSWGNKGYVFDSFSKLVEIQVFK